MEERCQIRLQLAEQLAICARLYAQIIVTIAKTEHSKEEYTHLYKQKEEAQHRAEEAFVQFEEHLETHRCYKAASS
jgi:predicted transcriptional regulator